MDIKVSQNTAVVFDLDDTLYKEIDYLRSAYREIAQELQLDSWQLLYAEMFSLYRCGEDVFGFLTGKFDVSLKHLLETYRNHRPDIRPLEGVLTCFKAIKDKKGKLGLITDGRSHTQRAKIEALQLAPFFDFVIISEEIGSEKPDPDNFRAMEAALNCAEYTYVGDNFKKDFLAPNSLGWQTIGLLDNGLNIHKQNCQYIDVPHRPHHLINGFQELVIR